MNVFALLSDDNEPTTAPVTPPEQKEPLPTTHVVVNKTNKMSNVNYCECCDCETNGFCCQDNSADREDVLFICYSCGSLMTNTQENLDYYNKLMEIFDVVDASDLDKSIAFENHFQGNYSTPKIEKAVKKYMFESGRWI